MKKKIENFILEGLNNVYTAASILIGQNDEIIMEEYYGTKDGISPINDQTLFDIASLTKIVSTTTAIMKLYDEKKIHLDDKIKKYLDVKGEKGEIKIKQLLLHESGMQPYSELWQKYKNKELMDKIIQIQPQNKPWTQYDYSCLNFITLMKIVENVSKTPYQDYIKNLFNQIGMFQTTYNPQNTENIVQTSIRDGIRLQGKSDDELCYYLGGISGNAGIYSNIKDLRKYVLNILNPKIISKKTIDKFTKTTIHKGEKYAHLGFMAPPQAGCTNALDEKSFGHNGFTGTSIWIRPDGKFSIFLTNSVYYDRRAYKDKLQIIRNNINDAIFKEGII